MGVLYCLLRPAQLRAIIQWKLWHEPVHHHDYTTDPETLKICFQLLDLTSRSFAAVIKELHPELLVPVCIFYLVLRGLDTVEDDMSLDNEVKIPLLRSFNERLREDGWSFDGSGPNEKDRDVLVRFDNIIAEFSRLKPVYQDIISDITNKMGNGMADYALNAEHNTNGVNTVADYETYCHYVAGLVGDGLTRLFVASELANPKLLERPRLAESMGQFLQKTNIIRDVHEDWEDGRRFWPKEIWSKYFDKWDDMFLPENRERALSVSSEMVLNALGNVEECLFYMAALREQSVFNFSMIPQAMAIATLELVFRNPAIFERNIKITKGDACRIMTRSTQNLQVACEVFRDYTRRIHHKNDPRDPNFTAISLQCARIEQFIESIFPRTTAEQAKLAYDTSLEAKRNTSSFSENAALLGIVAGCFVVLAGLMIGSAFTANVVIQKYWPGLLMAPGPVLTEVAQVVHEEL